MNHRMRQTHRWVSLAFTAAVLANFAALAAGRGAPPAWVTYAPLPPLAVLLGTGLYLFALPYVVRRRGTTPAGAHATRTHDTRGR